MYIRNNKIILSFIILVAVLIPQFADGATYYISTSGDNGNPGTQSQPLATFTYAFSQMSAGDTLYIMDGEYNQQIKDMPSGTAGNYTKIYALNDHMVDIDGQGSYPSSEWEALLYIKNKSYVEIKGLKVHHSSTSNHVLQIIGSNHINIKVSGFWQPSYDKYHYNVNITNSSDLLLEDVWAFGRGRYTVVLGTDATNVTLRRVVTRWDQGTWSGEPVAGFSVYKAYNNLLENTITFDHRDTGGHSAGTHGYYNISWKAGLPSSSNNRYFGSMSFNLPHRVSAYSIQGESSAAVSNTILKDCLAFDAYRGMSMTGSAVLNTIIQNCSFINNTNDGTKSHGIFHGVGGTDTVVLNSLFANNVVDGFHSNGGSVTISYSTAFNNDGSDYSGASCSTGCRTDNPEILYPLRTESASTKGTGEGGADIGANILKRYVDGSLTENSLWPWPYENWIKEDMCDPDLLQEVGRRDSDTPKWCTTNKTLTEYIWEYLGNSCPAEICNYVADNDAPTIPINLVATAASSSQINLSWSASTDNIDVSGYNIYRDGTQVGTSASTNYSDMGLNPSTLYSYNVSAFDMAGNESAQSASDSATTQAAGAGPDVENPTPVGLSATAASSSIQINLSWSASTDNVGVTGYKIYRDGVQVDMSASTSYSDTGLSPSTLYSYTVSAYDAAGNDSAQSASASATTQDSTLGPDTEAPSIPAGISSEAVSSMQINLNWNISTDNVGVSGYSIYRDGVQVGTSTLTTYSDVGLSPSTNYSHEVSAYDAAGNESVKSSYALATTKESASSSATMIIKSGDVWKYLKGYSDPAVEWNELVFDDSSWLEGPTGIGYGDDDDETVLSNMTNNYLTVYTRKSFTVADPLIITKMTLLIDYDDGFVAYINGLEVARSFNISAEIPTSSTIAAPGRESGTPESIDLSSYINYLSTGNNVLAIEIHNSAISSSDLSLIPELLLIDESDQSSPSPPSNLQ